MENAISQVQGQYNFQEDILWVTQKSIEEDGKWAQKKEEQEKEIRKNSLIKWIK